MKVGILQCDSVRSQFQGRHGDYPEMITSLLRQVLPAIHIEVYDAVAGHYPPDPGECDAYITTGSKASVYDAEAWITKLQDFIIRLHQTEQKLIAICFGHQLVAQAFGGRVVKSEKGWGVGVHTMTVMADKPWMEPPLAVAHLLVSHQDQVVALPPEAELIAGSSFCPYAMFQLGSNILTVQGHPEFSAPYAADLMGFRREILGETCYRAGIESLQTATDEVAIARWMMAFISDAST